MLPKNKIQKVLSLLSEKYHRSNTALEFNNTFQLLVSTMLAAQSTDKQVNNITRALYQELPDVSAYTNLTLSELSEKIKSVGLYRNKARNILAMANMIKQKYNGKVPPNREELMKLPGVGRKTANVVLSVGFNQDAIAVDTHVFRVSNRIGLAQGKNVKETEYQLMDNIPKKNWSNAHHWLIWHGRRICKAQRPLCGECFLKNYCEYFQKIPDNHTVKK
jgi:endonuclease-3